MIGAPCLLVLAMLCAEGRISVPTDRGKQLEADSEEDAFERYVRMYNKSYVERAARLSAFRDSLRRIEAANARRNGTSSALYGLTRFADLTADEFRAMFSPANRRSVPMATLGSLSYPPRFDWRSRGVIGPVRNQGSCGACWAFSTVACIESMRAIETGVLKELSVQQMIDCSGNRGCDGGDTCAALDWLDAQNVSLAEEADYPFSGVTGQCRTSTAGVRLRGYSCGRFVGNEDALLGLLANWGPLAAAVDASSWQDYLGGVVQYHCEAGRNHAVQVVGYDTTGDVPYYVLRNSWGTDFGHDGYLYLAAGKNLCGIAEEVSAVRV